jgi:NTP pyrophosphatase (non-canonical NTP hydrolase)
MIGRPRDGTAMPDETTTIAQLKDAVKEFADERDWGQFHNPKNLSMSLACEAAELLEHFLWVEGEPSRRVVDDAAELAAVRDEIADVVCLALNLCVCLKIDLADGIRDKMKRNAVKYPAEQYRGRYRIDRSDRG